MPDNSNLDLDLSFLHEIADGSNEFIVESIDMFLLHTPMLLDEIANGITGNDWKSVTASAHKLKSNLGFFGMLTSQSLMQDIELQSKQESPDKEDVMVKFGQTNALITPCLAALKNIKTEKEAGL